MKAPLYTANLYVGESIVSSKEGDDENALYEWLLTKAQGVFGDVRGEVVDNKTSKIVQRFKKSPPD